MSERLGCSAPPMRLHDGTSRMCANYGHRWQATKDGRSGEVIRCNDHAAALRANGYEVHKSGSVLKGGQWDMTSANSLEAAAGWLRKNSGALLVLVVRAGDAVVVVDQGIAPGDVLGMLEAGLPEALERLDQAVNAK